MPTKKKPTSAEPVKPRTRREALDYLRSHDYSGPTSFAMRDLALVCEWVEAGSPRDTGTGVPKGALYAVHPDLRPARPAREKKPRPLSRQSAELLAEAQRVLAEDGPTALTDWLAARLAGAQS